MNYLKYVLGISTLLLTLGITLPVQACEEHQAKDSKIEKPESKAPGNNEPKPIKH